MLDRSEHCGRCGVYVCYLERNTSSLLDIEPRGGHFCLLDAYFTVLETGTLLYQVPYSAVPASLQDFCRKAGLGELTHSGGSSCRDQSLLAYRLVQDNFLLRLCVLFVLNLIYSLRKGSKALRLKQPLGTVLRYAAAPPPLLRMDSPPGFDPFLSR